MIQCTLLTGAGVCERTLKVTFSQWQDPFNSMLTNVKVRLGKITDAASVLLVFALKAEIEKYQLPYRTYFVLCKHKRVIY